MGTQSRSTSLLRGQEAPRDWASNLRSEVDVRIIQVQGVGERTAVGLDVQRSPRAFHSGRCASLEELFWAGLCPPKRNAEVLTPSSSECDLIGNRVVTDVMSSSANVLIRKGGITEQRHREKAMRDEQRLDTCIDKPRIAGSYRGWEKRAGATPTAFWGNSALPTP